MDSVVIDNLRNARSELKQRLEQLREEVSGIQEDIQAIDRVISRYTGRDSSSRATQQPAVWPDSVGRTLYAEMSLKNAVMTVLKREVPKSLRAAQIKEALIAGGFTTKSENFTNMVFTTLSTLCHDGMVEKVDAGLYKAKNGESESTEK